ncbi:MAG: CopD family protein [Balneolaceae bacterium]
MYFWSLFFHVIFATFWIGGMLFTAAVLVPVSRDKMFKNRRGELFKLAGTLFSRISWIIFILMIVTGTMALYGKGFTTEVLLSADFWQTRYGKTLMGKLHIFSLVLIVSAVHDFWLGPKAAVLMDMDKDTESPVTKRFRKASSWAGRVNLILGLGILYYALSLVR